MSFEYIETKMVRRILLTALAVLTFLTLMGGTNRAAADDTEDPGVRTVIKPLAYIETADVEDVLELLDVEWVAKQNLNAVVLRGKIANVEAALRAIESLDYPVPTLDLKMFIVSASKEREGLQGIPQELETVVSQLGGVFGYSGFELLESMSLKVQTGNGGLVEGGLRLGKEDGEPVSYGVRFRNTRVAPPDDAPLGRMIYLDDLRFWLRAESDVGKIETEVVVREGQKAVIGRSTPKGIGDSIVLVIEATIVKD
jgi:hypothetical protein